jgi:hypothetical protein
MDGWWLPYTTVIFRNISETTVVRMLYALGSFILQGYHDGQIYKDLLKGTVVVQTWR